MPPSVPVTNRTPAWCIRWTVDIRVSTICSGVTPASLIISRMCGGAFR